jgi:dipeptidase
MCDTFVATPSVTAQKRLILAKNSDREPNEAQAIVRVPRQKFASGATQQTTFIRVPAVSETAEVLLSKPFQMWGAEMGVNEYGVVIGNEAVFTKVKLPRKDDGLTGMDLLRLALERCKTASEARDCIVELLTEFGQDACGGYQNRKFYYSNSFIIADASGDAFVLETAGREWAYKKVEGYRAISNGLSLESEFDRSSPDLVDRAKREGWLKPHETFSFKKAYSDWFFTFFGKCQSRFALSMALGESQQGQLTLAGAMKILRSHGKAGAGPRALEISAHECDMGTLCMHGGGPHIPSQTTGAMAIELERGARPVVWITGTSAPCLSIFKPVVMGGKTLTQGTVLEPSAYPDKSLWWKGEKLHRLALRSYSKIAEFVVPEARELESEWLNQVAIYQQRARAGEPTAWLELDQYSKKCFERGEQLIDSWLHRIERGKLAQSEEGGLIFRMYWKKQNQKARLSLS